MKHSHKLTNKNVLVTAGAQGIGASITRHFIDSGANVAIHYYSSVATANELKEYALQKGQKAVVIQGDLTQEAAANALVQKTIAAFGGIDILINNTGSLVARNLLPEITTEFWQQVMDINLTSMLFVLTFTRALSTELGPEGVRVNAVAPGLILGTSFHNTHTTKASAAATVAGIPIQRAGNAADVARAVLYLASEYDGFITGATLDINGGVYNM